MLRNNFVETINRAPKEELKRIAITLGKYIAEETLGGREYMDEMFKSKSAPVIYGPETLKRKVINLYNDSKFNDPWFDPLAILEIATFCGPRSTGEISFFMQSRFGQLEIEGHKARMNRIIREVLSICGFKNESHVRVETDSEGNKKRTHNRRWQLPSKGRYLSIEQLLGTFNAIYAQYTEEFSHIVHFSDNTGN